MSGKPDAALREVNVEKDKASHDYALALVQQLRGDRPAADAALANLVAEYPDQQPYAIAEIYALRGELDRAFAWLDRAYAARDVGVLGMRHDDFLEHLRKDPRFDAFAKKAGV